MEPVLSIIIPVYNVEKYFDACIQSVINQPYESIEVILVDDGSPDRSGEMCDEYAQKDNRIQVIHKKNGGLSSARNAGIDIAKGRYITFVDSDDTIAEDTYSINVPILLEDDSIDMLEFPVYIHYQSSSQHMRRFDNVHIYSTREIFIHWIKNRGYLHAYSWNKIYKKELFNNIRFPENVTFEDTHTTPLILDQIQHIYYSASGFYYYYSRGSSITRSATYNNFCDLLQADLQILKLTNKYPELEKEKKIIYLHTVNVLIDVYKSGKRENKPFTILLKEVEMYHLSFVELLKLKIPLYMKLKNIPLSLFGIKFHISLFSIIP